MNYKLSNILLLAFTLFANQSFSQTPAIDSIRNLIPTLEGQARLDAYRNLCELNEVSDNTLNVKIKFLNEYIEEAIRQDNLDEELNAKHVKLVFFYNENLEDSLFLSLPSFMELSLNHKHWDSYFSAYDLKVSMYIFNNRTQTALREAQKMYQMATNLNNANGLGIAAANIGAIYGVMKRFDEANKFYTEAIQIFKNIQEGTHLIMACCYYSILLLDQKKYDEALSALQDFKDAMIELDQKYKDLGLDIKSVDMYWYYYEIYSSFLNMYTGNLPLAREYLEKAIERSDQRTEIPKTKLHKAYIYLYELEGKYELALSLIDQLYKDEIDFGDFTSALSTIETKATLLLKAGKGIESAELYQEYIAKVDSLRDLELNAQLDELHKIYEVDKITGEKEKLKSRLISLTAGCVLLILMLGGWIFYSQRLRKKNRALYKQIREQDKMEEAIEERNSYISLNSTDGDIVRNGKLFAALKELMANETILEQTEIDRKSIAERLNTNEKYLFDSVKEHTGLSFSEYINNMRLNLAKELLLNKSNYTVEDIAIRAGFGSGRTFYRRFREKYNLSPIEFRKAASEGK